MAKPNVEYLEILYEALGARYGLIVETNDAERLRQRLYAIRRDVEDFTPLAFIISPENGKDLWIVNKEAHRAEE